MSSRLCTPLLTNGGVLLGSTLLADLKNLKAGSTPIQHRKNLVPALLVPSQVPLEGPLTPGSQLLPVEQGGAPALFPSRLGYHQDQMP